jgi:hypothetical protein
LICALRLDALSRSAVLPCISFLFSAAPTHRSVSNKANTRPRPRPRTADKAVLQRLQAAYLRESEQDVRERADVGEAASDGGSLPYHERLVVEAGRENVERLGDGVAQQQLRAGVLSRPRR